MNVNLTLFLISCLIFLTCSQLIVEVQLGAEVTFNCTIPSSFPGHISWFHLNDQSITAQICSMFDSKSNVTFYSKAQKEKYEMTLNNTTMHLTIKKVESSDAGLYFCGERMNHKTVIFTAALLKIQEPNILIPIMAGVIALLVVLVGGLILKICKPLKGPIQKENNETPEATELTYAKINFRSKRASVKDLQPDVEYATTRRT